MRHPRVLVIAAGLAVLSGWWFLRPDLPQAAKPIAGEHIIAFGDSLVAGQGASAGRDLVSVLSQRLGVPIINAGRNGDTSRSALARLDHAVVSRNPRVVIVLLGGNDLLRRIPREETFENLAAIVERIRRRGAAVLLVGLSIGPFMDPYARGYEDLARRTSAALVPDILDGIIGRADRMSDGVHPNDRGYQMMADRLEPVLRQIAQPD